MVRNGRSGRQSLEDLAWHITHRDYRFVLGGERAVLVNSPRGTTAQWLHELTDTELAKYLGNTTRK